MFLESFKVLHPNASNCPWTLKTCRLTPQTPPSERPIPVQQRPKHAETYRQVVGRPPGTSHAPPQSLPHPNRTSEVLWTEFHPCSASASPIRDPAPRRRPQWLSGCCVAAPPGYQDLPERRRPPRDHYGTGLPVSGCLRRMGSLGEEDVRQSGSIGWS